MSVLWVSSEGPATQWVDHKDLSCSTLHRFGGRSDGLPRTASSARQFKDGAGYIAGDNCQQLSILDSKST